MDGLSGAASVIAVVQIAQAVGSALKDYYEGVRDARDDIQKLYNAVKSLEGVLSRIQDTLNHNGDPLAISHSIARPLRQTQSELDTLRSDLNNAEIKPSRLVGAVRSLTWPFKKKDVEKAVATIERHKLSLNLAIGVEGLTIALKHFDISGDIRSDIRAARDDASRRRIIDWLSKGIPNPSKYHNVAREKHEETTGSWLIDGEDFKSWLEKPNSFMWLNGGAGAGKSILCSTAIERAKKISHEECDSVVPVVYWYFSFADIETQNLINALCSLISDICSNRRDTPDALQTSYDQANYGQQKPSLKNCIIMLKEVIAGFSNVYIFIDALDECPKLNEEREILLDVLDTIHSWKLDCLHILSSSRRETDIVESFGHIFNGCEGFYATGAQGQHVDNDIRKYLKHSLLSRRFSKWKPTLKHNVEETLASRANGMFRLVALQLDALSGMRIESQIRKAMQELPKTLDSFYDRILQEIDDPTNQRLVHFAFQWLAFSPRPLSLKELAEAVILRPEQKLYLRVEDRLMDYKDLLDIFPSGLVTSIVVRRGRNDSINVVGGIDETDSEFDSHDELEIDGGISETGDGSEAGNVFETNNNRTAREELEALHESETIEETGSGDDGERQDQESESEYDYDGYEYDGELDERKEKLMVQFAHFSVQEYLISARISTGPASKYHINEIPAHDTIARSCFAYLLQAGSETPPITKNLFADYPLLHYSANCWPYHLQVLEGKPENKQRDDLLYEFLRCDRYPWKIWAAVGFNDALGYNGDMVAKLPFKDRRIDPRPSLIHPITWLSGLGLVSPLQTFLRQNPILDDIPQTDYCGNPLHFAILMGNRQVVEMLIAAGSNVNRRGGIHDTPLNAACWSGNIEIVKALLDEGAEIDCIETSGVSPLASASLHSRTDIIRLLIDRGADIKGRYVGVEALGAACHCGDSDLALCILQKGIDVNSIDEIFRKTALQQAAQNGHLGTVQMLVQKGAKVIVQRKWGQCNALETAENYVHHSIANYLRSVLEEEEKRELVETVCA